MGKKIKFTSITILLGIYLVLFIINVFLESLGIKTISIIKSPYLFWSLAILHYLFFSLKQEKDIKDLNEKIKKLEKGIKEKTDTEIQ